MTKQWLCLCFILFSMLVAGSAWAAEKAPESPGAPLLLQTSTPAAPALCKTTPLARTQAPTPPAGLFGEGLSAPASESCFPAECGSGANPPQCGSSCCRLKCCIC